MVILFDICLYLKPILVLLGSTSKDGMGETKMSIKWLARESKEVYQIRLWETTLSSSCRHPPIVREAALRRNLIPYGDA